MCAIFGVIDIDNASRLVKLGLHSLNHRGTDGSGIISFANDNIYTTKKLGLVQSLDCANLPGEISLGQLRYSTTGENSEKNLQPVFGKTKYGWLAIAHNGNLTNTNVLHTQLSEAGAIFNTSTDTECLLHLIAKSKCKNLPDAVLDVLPKLQGAYCFLIANAQYLIAVRDPHGYRPLVLGISQDGYILASETCALNFINADYVREVRSGEILIFQRGVSPQSRSLPPQSSSKCIFELIYFSKPDSETFGISVYAFRKKLGTYLAVEQPCDADIIVPVPDSGVPSAIGYSQESKIPFEMGIVRSHHCGRTFIQPTQDQRSQAVKMKLSVVSNIVKDKKVVLIDDSIVRGTTMQKIVKLIRKQHAKEVHLRITSPPVMYPCYFGIDTPEQEQLLANKMSTAEMAHFLGADSLGFISLESLSKTWAEFSNEKHCTSCFNGKYITKPN